MLHYYHFQQAKKLPETLMIGNDIIDQEHSALLEHLACLERLGHLPSSDEAVGEVLHRISYLLIEHFTHEETIMKSSSMPEATLSEHMNAHLNVIDELCQLQTLMMGAPVFADEILSMIEKWVLTHIRDFDLQIKQYA